MWDRTPYYFVPSNERLDIALEGVATILYKSEADRLNVNYIQTELTIDFNTSLYKNFSNHEVKVI